MLKGDSPQELQKLLCHPTVPSSNDNMGQKLGLFVCVGGRAGHYTLGEQESVVDGTVQMEH